MTSRKVKKGGPAAKVFRPTKTKQSTKKRTPKVILMDLIMPNGKALKDNSLEDVEGLIKFFTSLAARMRK